MDEVGGFLLTDGSHAKALTGVDDHSRYCVSAALMARERTRPVCDALGAALARYGVPQQILTDISPRTIRRGRLPVAAEAHLAPHRLPGVGDCGHRPVTQAGG